MHGGKQKEASIGLLISAVTRYEVWLSIPFLYLKKEKRLYFVAPSIFFILVWLAYTVANHSFFPETILIRSQEVLNFEIGKGAVDGGVGGRTFSILGYFLISSPFVYAAGLFYAASNIKKIGLYAFTLFNLMLVILVTMLGLGTGSFRYFSIALPLVCIFAGVQVSKIKRLWPIVLVSLIIALPFYFNLYSNLDALYQPMVRAGEFVGNTGATGVISNSPVSLYFTGFSAAHIFGASILKNISQKDGTKWKMAGHNLLMFKSDFSQAKLRFAIYKGLIDHGLRKYRLSKLADLFESVTDIIFINLR